MIIIIIVPVAASETSLNDSETNCGGGNMEFTVILSMLHLVADRMKFFKILYILSTEGLE